MTVQIVGVRGFRANNSSMKTDAVLEACNETPAMFRDIIKIETSVHGEYLFLNVSSTQKFEEFPQMPHLSRTRLQFCFTEVSSVRLLSLNNILQFPRYKIKQI